MNAHPDEAFKCCPLYRIFSCHCPWSKWSKCIEVSKIAFHKGKREKKREREREREKSRIGLE